MRILCVDDDPVARVIYTRGLGEVLPEDEIQAAASGEEAIELLNRLRFDVVVTDLAMPGLSGLDVLRAARDRDGATEVIVITGKASIVSAVEAMRDGARDYIEKPIDVGLLREKLENIREYQRRARESEELREAKEQVETQAGKELRLLELRISRLEEQRQQALEILRDGSGGEIELRVDRALRVLDAA